MRQRGSRAPSPRAVGPCTSHSSWKTRGRILGFLRALATSECYNHHRTVRILSSPGQQGRTWYSGNATGRTGSCEVTRSHRFWPERFPATNQDMLLFRYLYHTMGYTPHVVHYHTVRCDTHFGVYSTLGAEAILQGIYIPFGVGTHFRAYKHPAVGAHSVCIHTLGI